MRQLFDVTPANDRLGNAEPLPAIYPKHKAPMLALSEEGERELVSAQWVFLTENKSKKTGAWLKPRAWNNARDDKIRTSGLWKHAFENKRCLIPASAFVETTGRNPATYHWFRVNGAECFAFGGIWKTHTATVGA